MQDYIKIIDAQVSEESLINYTQYQLKGSRQGQEFQINKRYNDFVILKETFTRNWPGCFIPPIPQKKSLGNLDSNVINYRQKYLSFFLKKILKIPYLWFSQEIEIFIKGNSDQLQDLQKNQSIENMIIKYQQIFTFNDKQEVYDIEQFQISIINTLPMIENFSIMAKNFVKEKDSTNYGYVMFVEQFLPQFEKLQTQSQNVFSSIDIQNNFKESKEGFKKNEFIKIYEYTKGIERELLTCKEALQQRQQINQKVKDEEDKLYKLNIQLQEIHSKTLIFGKKEDKIQSLQQQIQNQTNIIDQLKIFSLLINKLISQQEIPNYHKNNKDKYYRLIKIFSEFQIKFHQAQIEFWEKVQLKL